MALADPNRLEPLPDEVKLRVFEEAQKVSLDYENEGYCPQCGVNVNEKKCPKGPKAQCQFYLEYWEQKEQKTAEEEELGEFKL